MTKEFEPAQAAEFSTEDCLTLLATQQVGRLVTTEAAVEVRPVNFGFLDGVIVLRMDEPVAEDSLVSFEVDNIDRDQQEGWSVVATGRASSTRLTGLALDLIDQPTPWAPGDKPWLTRIAIERISGRWVRAARTRTTLDQRGYL